MFKVLHIKYRGKTGGKLNAFDPILDMFYPDDLDYADFTGVPAVCAGTGFDITGNFDHTDVPPGRNTPLIEGKTIFLFRLLCGLLS